MNSVVSLVLKFESAQGQHKRVSFH